MTVQVTGVQQLVRFHLQTTDTQGAPVDTIQVGDLVVLQVSVEDLRADPSGVFSAYLDVTYDSTPLRVAGDIQFNTDKYPFSPSGSADVPGELDEVGAVDGISPTGAGAIVVFQVPFAAENPGQVTFRGDPADVPVHEVTLFGDTAALDPRFIDYGSVVLDVTAASGFTNVMQPLDVNNDGMISPVDALTVITEITNGGARQLVRTESRAAAARSATAYVDVNGDGFVTPLDALLVINWLTESANAARSAPRAALSAGADFGHSGDHVDAFGEIAAIDSVAVSDSVIASPVPLELTSLHQASKAP